MFNLEDIFLKSVLSVITGVILTSFILHIFYGNKLRLVEWELFEKFPSAGIAAVSLLILSFCCFYIANLFRFRNASK